MSGAWVALGVCCLTMGLLPDGQLAVVCHGQRTCDAEWGVWESWAVDADREELHLVTARTWDGRRWTVLVPQRLEVWRVTRRGRLLILTGDGGRIRTFRKQEDVR